MEINKLKQICLDIKSWDLDVSDDHILECATRIFNSNNIGETRDKDNTLATEKQKAFLEKMHIETPKGLTKSEASKLIDERTRKDKPSKDDPKRDYYGEY